MMTAAFMLTMAIVEIGTTIKFNSNVYAKNVVYKKVNNTTEETSSIESLNDSRTMIFRDKVLDDKMLLAQLIMSEAGNQPLTGMRFVADVVLNRVDDPRFPNTIRDVIYQEGQFSVIANGYFDSVKDSISEDAIKAAELEMEERLDYGILYFSSTETPVNGEKAFKYYDHWFSY